MTMTSSHSIIYSSLQRWT